MYGGEISFEIKEHNDNGKIIFILPIIEGDKSTAALRLGKNIIRIGYKCGRYYDLKNVKESTILKIKQKGEVLVGERDENNKTKCTYSAVVVA